MAESKKDIITEIPQAEKYVSIKLPREKKDVEDEVVWVNGKRYLIKKGVPVNVPESVALILEQKEQMLEYIFDYEDSKQKND